MNQSSLSHEADGTVGNAGMGSAPPPSRGVLLGRRVARCEPLHIVFGVVAYRLPGNYELPAAHQERVP